MFYFLDANVAPLWPVQFDFSRKDESVECRRCQHVWLFRVVKGGGDVRSELPHTQQGLQVLGTLLGHPEFVRKGTTQRCGNVCAESCKFRFLSLVTSDSQHANGSRRVVFFDSGASTASFW